MESGEVVARLIHVQRWVAILHHELDISSLHTEDRGRKGEDEDRVKYIAA